MNCKMELGNTKIKNTIVPDQYLPQFKATVSLLNSAEHFENSLREYTSLVRMTPKLVSHGGVSCPRKVDSVKLIGEYGLTAIESMKEVNSIIEQTHFKKQGKDDINNMQYSLLDMVNNIYYLSLENQEKVSKFIDSLK